MMQNQVIKVNQNQVIKVNHPLMQNQLVMIVNPPSHESQANQMIPPVVMMAVILVLVTFNKLVISILSNI